MTNRRGFLGSIFAAAAAPAIVRAESLMKIYVPPQEILLLEAGQGYARALAKSMHQTKERVIEQLAYDANTFTYSDGSTILTRQQVLERLLPDLNRLFGVEYDRYTENHT